MKKPIITLALPVIALLMGGCLPDEFIWWSPDGQTAAVRTSEGLRLAGANGELSPVVLPGEIQSAKWQPNSSRLVVSRSWEVKDWAAAEEMIPREEAAATMQLARAMPDFLKAGLTASGGSLDSLDEKFFKALGITSIHAFEPAWACALSLHREQIRAVIAGFTNAAAIESELFSGETNGISVFEISMLSIRNGLPEGAPRVILRSLRPLLNPVLSSRHLILAFRTAEGALTTRTLEGGDSRVVADENVAFAAWSADGRDLIHVVMRESDAVGEIRSRTVMGESGELLEDFGPPETLAMAAFVGGTPPRLSVLPDGRILFASAPITLPARMASIQAGARFFLLDPAQPSSPPLAVAIKEGSLPDDLNAFALSPDGRFVAVVESGTDAVGVLELATGRAKIISPSNPGWKSRMIPAWRNHRELSFAALPSPSASRPELILWQGDAPHRFLSKDWPDGVVKPWLEAPRGGGD